MYVKQSLNWEKWNAQAVRYLGMVLRCSGKVGIVMAMSPSLGPAKNVEILRGSIGRSLGLRSFQLDSVAVIILGSLIWIKPKGFAFCIV